MTADPTGEVPEEVLDLLRCAVRGDLLSGVEAVAAGLLGAGWVRGGSGGSWSCGADPAWTALSGGRVPHVSVFTSGDHGDLLRRAAAVRELLGSGRAGPVLPGEPDPDWSTWTGGDAVVSLNVTPEHPWKDRPIPAVLQLAVERAGPADDPAVVVAPAANEGHRRAARDHR